MSNKDIDFINKYLKFKTTMKKIFTMFAALLLFALCVSAQVTTAPAIIEKGYTGKITITFDPKGGNGGMATATKCYAHTGYCTKT